MKIMTKHHLLLTTSLLALFAAGTAAAADRGDRVEQRLDRRGDRRH